MVFAVIPVTLKAHRSTILSLGKYFVIIILTLSVVIIEET